MSNRTGDDVEIVDFFGQSGNAAMPADDQALSGAKVEDPNARAEMIADIEAQMADENEEDEGNEDENEDGEGEGAEAPAEAAAPVEPTADELAVRDRTAQMELIETVVPEGIDPLSAASVGAWAINELKTNPRGFLATVREFASENGIDLGEDAAPAGIQPAAAAVQLPAEFALPEDGVHASENEKYIVSQMNNLAKLVVGGISELKQMHAAEKQQIAKVVDQRQRAVAQSKPLTDIVFEATKERYSDNEIRLMMHKTGASDPVAAVAQIKASAPGAEKKGPPITVRSRASVPAVDLSALSPKERAAWALKNGPPKGYKGPSA